MIERNAQSFDLDKYLAMLEAWIRNKIPIDIPVTVEDSVDHYEEMTSDEREIFLDQTIRMSRSRSEYFGSQLAWAVLKGLSERILERDEVPPKALAQTAYAHGSGRESLPPDVEVEVRAGERVECSLYVPADGATT